MFVTKFIDNTRYGQSSVASLTSYLEKERLIQEQLDGASSRQLSAYLDKQNDVVRVEGQEYFFNGSGKIYDSEDVTKAIDANVKGLKQKEARYYTFSISPSAQEIKHLRRTIADTKQTLLDAGETIPADFEDCLLRSYLKEYSVKCMDAYAQNFDHPEIKDNKNLLWFGMVEKDRYWKSHDKEVRTNNKIDKEIAKLHQQINETNEKEINQKIVGLEKKYIREFQVRVGGSKEILRPMMPKAGDNWHIHVAVSRRDITNSINLSPNANGRGSKKHQLNGKSVRVGFNREAYKIKCEQIFDKQFIHSRLMTESYEKAKELRKVSAYAFEKQLIKDRATRKVEDMEFNSLKTMGYKEYCENIIQAEKIDARHLMQLKGYLVRQIQLIDIEVDVDKLMSCDLEHLQEKLAQLDADRDMTIHNWSENIAVNVGDKFIHTSGLQGYNPIRTTHKILRRGIMMSKAIDRRREMYDKWRDIYTETWNRENYLFDSISDYRNNECFFVQAEHLEGQFGESVILANAHDYAATIEQMVVKEFLKEHWPEWVADTINEFAIGTFGLDAGDIQSIDSFEKMAGERLLPEDARKCFDEVKKRCEHPKDLAALRDMFARQNPARAAEMTKNLDACLEDQIQLKELRMILTNSELTCHEKEEALMKLALNDKKLDKVLRDLRSGTLKILGRQNPKIKYGELKESLKKLFEDMRELVVKRRAEFVTMIDEYIQKELPGYQVIVEKESQLDQLIRDLTPDQDKYAERLLEIKNEISRQMSSHAAALFEKHSQNLFGTEVRLSNEQDFVKFVDNNYVPQQADNYKQSLNEIKAKIEEKRRTIIQQYVNSKILPAELEKVRRQQKYINRYINKKYKAAIAKEKKENLQRKVAEACKRAFKPEPSYRVFDHVAQKQVTTQAMAKVSQVKIMTFTPQQLAVKAAFKLLNILTKGY